MAEIKLNELGEKAQLFLTDLMPVSDSNGVLYGNKLQDFANFFSTASGVDFKGSISAGTYASKTAGWYFATNTGNYIMGSTTIAVDVSDTLTIIIVPTAINDSSKVEVPLNISGGTLLTSYANVGGTGNRTSIITASISSQLSSNLPSLLINGVTTNEFGFLSGVTTTGYFIKFDFQKSSSKLINEIKWIQSGTQTHGVWKIQGSNDDTTWIDLNTDFTLGGATTQIIPLTPNAQSFRYFRFLGISGITSGSPFIQEIEFKITNSYTNEITSFNKIPKHISSNLIEAWFFNETENNLVKGNVKGLEINLDLPTTPNYTKTSKGIKLSAGLIQTPALSSVRAVTFVYRTNAGGNTGFILSYNSNGGAGVLQESVDTLGTNKILGHGTNWHEVDSMIPINGTGAKAYETNRGSWIAYHTEHNTSQTSIYGLGGRHSTTTSRCADFEIAMAFFWNKIPTTDELNELGVYLRSEAKKIGIPLMSDDCDEKADLYLILGESNSIGRSTLANLSADDRALDLRKSLFVGQTGGGTGVAFLDKLEMGYNQQTDDLNNFGPEFGVAFQRRTVKSAKNNAVILNLGKGSTFLSPLLASQSSWNVDESRSDGLIYTALRQIYYTIEEMQSKNIGFNKIVRVGFWIGLNDATNTTYAPDVATYQGYLQAFYDKLVSVFNDYTVQMTLFRAHAADPTSNPTALSNVRTASDNFGTANANVTTVNTDAYGLEADGVHYDAVASKAMGIILHG